MRYPRSLPVAVVTPWWSDDAKGGAEFLAREIAHQFARRGYVVEVLTTCSRSAFDDWSRNHYPEGATEENGITVRRFAADARDGALFSRLYDILASGRLLAPSEERLFIENSINSRALCEFIEQNRRRYCFLFLPYLYGTTYFGVEASGGRAVVVPCLHNETAAYLSIFREMFSSVRGLWFLSEPERRLAQTLYRLNHVVCRVVGAGMDYCGRGDGARFRERHGLDGPCLLFSGRRVPGKGFEILSEYFGRFRARHGEWSLLLAGPRGPGESAEERPGVVDLGYLEKRDLWGAMAAADVFCQPSLYESFSYVLMEAWRQETPALVNAHCEVLRWHCEVSGGGLWFEDYDDFEAALLYLQRHPAIGAKIGRQGSRYVADNFSWDTVMEKAEELLSACEFDRPLSGD